MPDQTFAGDPIGAAFASVAETVPPPPGDHGQLSHDRRGPDAGRHASDVHVLLTEQRNRAEQSRERAVRDRDRNEEEIRRWERQVVEYDELLSAVGNVIEKVIGE